MSERSYMSETERLVTAAELERFPDDDYRYELVAGRVIRMSPVGYEHGRVVVRLCGLLDRHVRARDLGVVLTEVGFTLFTNPDTVRAPDVAFLRRERIPLEPRGFWKGAPDLSVEVLSPDDRPPEIRAKIMEYLGRGTPIVVVVDPGGQIVTVHRSPSQATTLRLGDVLDLDDVVAGFRCDVREIFE